MPPVDLVCGGDWKVACVTLADAGGAGKQPPDPPPAAATDDPDFPLESFEVRIGDEIQWRVMNAVYDREDSTKGSTNPKFSHANPRGAAASNSQLFSANIKAKPPVIGLPGKIQHYGYDGRCARRPPRVRIFPKKAGRAAGGGGGKSAVPELEPGSPKVSCFGKVLSHSERERCRTEWRRAVAAEEEGAEGRGWWRGFVAIFRCGGGDRAAEEEVKEEEKDATVPSKNIPGPVERVPESAAVAPGIGGMRRFASGRRAASWAAEAGAEAEGEGHVARSVPMDRVGLGGRRSQGSVDAE